MGIARNLGTRHKRELSGGNWTKRASSVCCKYWIQGVSRDEGNDEKNSR